jgi:hypothetical protein
MSWELTISDVDAEKTILGQWELLHQRAVFQLSSNLAQLVLGELPLQALGRNPIISGHGQSDHDVEAAADEVTVPELN